MRQLLQSLKNAHRLWLALAFLYAVAHLLLLRKADPRVALLFLVPPTIAFLILSFAKPGRASRFVCRLFLAMVTMAILLGEFRAFLPNLQPQFPGVPQQQDRILTFYVGVYLFFILGFLPPFVFALSLRRHSRGEPAELSQATCILGFMTWALMMLGFVANLPQLLKAML
jgi:hypothetical protein